MNQFILALKSNKLNVDIHQHSAFQIVITDDIPFDSIINGSVNSRIFGFIIKPQVPHHCQADQSILNIINIEPYSSLGSYIATKLLSESDAHIFRSREEINKFFNVNQGTFDINQILRSLSDSSTTAFSDERVLKTISFINANYNQRKIALQALADLTFLSPSRLGALFKQQTGSSISKYLLWTRLRHAIYGALNDKKKTLTTIAYENGFYDLPQFNRYMYEMLGVPPRGLKHNSDLIQVLTR